MKINIVGYKNGDWTCHLGIQAINKTRYKLHRRLIDSQLKKSFLPSTSAKSYSIDSSKIGNHEKFNESRK